MQITITENGITVKDWLYRNNISRVTITRLKSSERGILVNGERVTVRRVLSSGDLLELDIADSDADVNADILPRELPIDIIYEDDGIIAVNKPPEMPTHPSLGHFEDTLANALAFIFEKRGVPFVFRAINRLDRNTSGVVLLAKNRLAAAELSSLLQAGMIRKRYLAILSGAPEPSSGSIDRPIRREHESIITRTVCDITEPGAKNALTRYETLATRSFSDSDILSLVRAEPVTGRTHQLRVHFKSIGCPIVGDGLYGTAETEPTRFDRMIARHALHAESLTIIRKSGELTLRAPLPDDMKPLAALIAPEYTVWKGTPFCLK